MKPSRILIIDDDVAYCQQLQHEGQKHRLLISYCNNLADGLRILLEDEQISAVILDGRCFLESGQLGKPKSNFVNHALKQIDDIEEDFNRIIPKCVNTESPEDFREDFEGVIPVFTKQTNHKALFSWLKIEISRIPETNIKRQYYDIFNKLESRFTPEEEDLLIDLLQAKNSSDKAEIITSLSILRRLLERLIDIACIEKLGINPDDFTIGHGSRTRKILDAMHQKVLPPELFSSATILYKTCSKYGNHKDPVAYTRLYYFPEKYTIKRLIFSFFELVVFLLKA